MAVGQRFGTVISFVEARLKVKSRNQVERGRITTNQEVQVVQRDCTTLQYTMTSDSSKETLMIMPLKREYAPKFDAD